MKTLKEISTENFNDNLNSIIETKRKIKIAKITGSKGELAREIFRLKGLESSLEYHRQNMMQP